MPPSRSSTTVPSSHPLRERVRHVAAPSPAPEVPRATVLKAVLSVVLVIIAVILVASQLRSSDGPTSARRTSGMGSILRNAGHVIKRTKGYKIERY